MSTRIETKRLPHSQNVYYYEVQSYRDDNGKVKHKRRYLGKEPPKEIDGMPLGYRGAKLTEGKRVQMRTVNFGMEDFLDQTGIIKQIRQKYALIIFDNPIRGRNDWLMPFDMIGNIKREKKDNGSRKCD